MQFTAGPLTVKHIEPSGHERLMQALSVSYQPGGDAGASAKVFAFNTAHHPTDGAPVFDCGTVYVMNEAGATVAKYDLGGWGEPDNFVKYTGQEKLNIVR